jgi:hypothetical protein
VQLSFKANVSKAEPPVGQNTLIIGLRSKTNLVRVLVNVAIHDIPNRPLFIPVRNTSVYGGTQDESGLFVYGAQFRGAVIVNQFNAARAVVVRITNFKGETVEEQLLLED